MRSLTAVALLAVVGPSTVNPAPLPGTQPAAAVHLLPYKVTVTPRDSALGDFFVNTNNITVVFTVKNTGTNTDTYNLTCSAFMATCVSQSYYVATLMANQSIQVQVTFNTTSTAGSGAYVALEAASVNAVGDGQYSFTNWARTNYVVLVTPVTASAPNVNSFSSGFKAVFTVKNVGLLRDSFNLTCQPAANITCTSQTQAMTPGLNSFQTSVDTITYASGASGVAFIQQTASDSNTSTALGKYNFTVLVGPSSGVAVTPDSQAVGVRASVSASRPFKVRNTGTASNTFNITVPTCTGIASGCSASPTSLTLASGVTGTATVSFTSGSSGTGKISLMATQSNDPSVKDTGWVNLSVGTMQAPSADITAVNPGTMLERSLCVAVALAEASASECGDLRLAHPLPAVRTMNKARVPTLLYSSAAAHPYQLVAANVTLPAGAANPDTLVATLLLNGSTVRDSGKWSGAGMSPGRAIRVVLGYDGRALDSTGIYNYTVRVSNRYIGQPRQELSFNGQLVIVKRDSSAFGAGWWLAGLEMLKNPTSTAGTILWVGGDGSAHPYTCGQQTCAGVWSATTALDHPDTLKWNGTRFVRYLPGGLQVQFDGNGRHVFTINRLSDTTKFFYNGSSTRLDSLRVPVPALQPAVRYVFNYTGTQLSSVTAPPLGATQRVVALTLSGFQVTAITDPDTTTVSFGYDGTFANRVISRTNRRGYITSFKYDAGSKVTKDSLDPGSNQPVIVTQLRALETQGLHIGSLSDVVDTTLAYTLLDGPRNDVGDSTRLWLDRYGAPRRIVNAVGGQTTLSRSATWPALVTRVQAPNGRVMLAAYDSRGHDTSVTDSGTIVNGQPAVTRYVWDMTWDEVLSVILPEGDRTDDSLDASGNRVWQQDGRGILSRATFGYSSAGSSPAKRLTSIRLPGAVKGDSLHYDSVRGNLDTTWTPIGFRTIHLMDALGRDTLVITPIDSAQTKLQRQRFVYNLADRVTDTWTIGPAMPNKLDTLTSFKPDTTGKFGTDTTQVSPETLFVSNTYDAEGNLTQVLSHPDRWPLPLPVTDKRRYNGANLPTYVNLGSGPHGFTYDPAGNVTIASYNYGTVTSTYDALNRILTRAVPSVSYAQTGCGIWHPAWHPLCTIMVFPLYPNDGGTGYIVAADTSRFTYDIAGNMLEADNLDAKISRTYALNGAIQTDTLRLRDLTGSAFTVKYGLRYGYDRDLRRAWMRLPIVSGDSTTYSYSAPLGALTQVRDNSGVVAKFGYDSAARLDSIRIFPAGSSTAGITETSTFDPDSRLVTRARRTAGGLVLPQDALRYEARGKTFQAETQSAAVGHTHERTTMAYDGIGAIIGSEVFDEFAAWNAEEYRNDGLGNVWYERTSSTANGLDSSRWSAYTNIGGLLYKTARACTGSPHNVPDTLYQTVDWGGNVWSSGEIKGVCPYAMGTTAIAARYFFRADNRIAVVQRYNAVGSVNDGTWEEYRYDALGRRVMVRARRTAQLCYNPNVPGACQSFVNRNVWDGDQLLFEERHDSLDGGGSGPYLGTIGYLHGPGLDAPLWLLDARFTNPRVINYNWRGLAESSVWPDGTPADASLPNGPATNINWPAGQGVYYPSPPPNYSTTYAWIGNLPANGQDGTGLLYRRNRYYDPASGRFTQQDPIGLGGGMNLYGFATGDPVTFTDPFGLCPNIMVGDKVTAAPCELFGAVWAEARGASSRMQKGVAWSIVNRARSSQYGGDYHRVVWERAQYSFTSERAPRDANLQAYDRAVAGTPTKSEASSFAEMATRVEGIYEHSSVPFFGKADDPTQGATYYFSPQVGLPTPAWATDGTKTKTLNVGGEGQFYVCNNGRPRC